MYDFVCLSGSGLAALSAAGDTVIQSRLVTRAAGGSGETETRTGATTTTAGATTDATTGTETARDGRERGGAGTVLRWVKTQFVFLFII